MNVVPAQPFIVGVIRYITLTGEVVVLFRVSLIVAVEPDPAPFDIPATTSLVQANVHPTVPLVAVYVYSDPLQV